MKKFFVFVAFLPLLTVFLEAQVITRTDIVGLVMGEEGYVELDFTNNDDLPNPDNKDDVGNIWVVGGEALYANPTIPMDPTHSKFYQAGPNKDPILCGYTVKTEHGFSFESVWFVFYESIEIPTINKEETRDSVKVGELIEMPFRGDIYKMGTSKGTVKSRNGKLEVVSMSRSSATLLAIEAGSDVIELTYKEDASRQDINDVSTVSITVVSSEIQIPTAPESLTHKTTDSGQELTWTEVSDAVSYTVYRHTDDTEYTELVTGLESLTYTDDSDLVAGNYYYVVTAVNEAGESSYSNEVSVVITSIFEDYLEEGSSIAVVPNPIIGTAYLEFSLEQYTTNVLIDIYSVTGQQLAQTKTVSGKDFRIPISVDLIPSGACFIMININGQTKTKSFSNLK